MLVETLVKDAQRENVCGEIQLTLGFWPVGEPSCKKIRAVEFVQEIPKSQSGKILRRALKEKIRGHAQVSL